jgi:hypothetical protein
MRDWLVRVFRLHIDLPTVPIVLLLATLVYRPLLFLAIPALENVATEFGFHPSVAAFLRDFFANLAAGLILLVLGYWAFNVKLKSAYAGEFLAYDIKKGQEEEWGRVRLTYNLFSRRIRGLLHNDARNVDIEIDGMFERGQYIRGTYIERGRVARRRLGAFLMMLQGEGDEYRGKYVYVDPEEGHHVPSRGEAKWVRAKAP